VFLGQMEESDKSQFKTWNTEHIDKEFESIDEMYMSYLQVIKRCIDQCMPDDNSLSVYKSQLLIVKENVRSDQKYREMCDVDFNSAIDKELDSEPSVVASEPSVDASKPSVVAMNGPVTLDETKEEIRNLEKDEIVEFNTLSVRLLLRADACERACASARVIKRSLISERILSKFGGNIQHISRGHMT
jgi:hypothetical protein